MESKDLEYKLEQALKFMDEAGTLVVMKEEESFIFDAQHKAIAILEEIIESLKAKARA